MYHLQLMENFIMIIEFNIQLKKPVTLIKERGKHSFLTFTEHLRLKSICFLQINRILKHRLELFIYFY